MSISKNYAYLGFAALFAAPAFAQMEPSPATPPTATPPAQPMAAADVPASDLPDPAKINASKTVVENASNSPDHTTLVKAVKSAGLAETLSAAGPFTVFAPSNAGFDRLPPGTVDTLLKPENQGALGNVLKNHVVAGKVSGADLAKKIKAGKGKAVIETLAGDKLTATSVNNAIKITDSNGNASEVEKADIVGSNGVIHSINGVLIPSQPKPEAPAR